MSYQSSGEIRKKRQGPYRCLCFKCESHRYALCTWTQCSGTLCMDMVSGMHCVPEHSAYLHHWFCYLTGTIQVNIITEMQIDIMCFPGLLTLIQQILTNTYCCCVLPRLILLLILLLLLFLPQAGPALYYKYASVGVVLLFFSVSFISQQFQVKFKYTEP